MWKWEWVCWFVNLISRTPEDRLRRYRRLIERLSREADVDGKWWSVFHDYPKSAKASSATVQPSSAARSASETAIVVQGPVIDRDDLTLETLRLYRRTMPDSQLILSTWNDTRRETLQRIESLGVLIVTSEKPEIPGPHNLNLQIASTHRGLQQADEMGFRYAMKTRADTRIHMSDVDRFCIDMLNRFPLGASAQYQRQRILVMDFATRLYVPYHPSDMMMFGTTADLLNYWSLPLCGPDVTFQVRESFDAMLREATPEVVLCSSFLQRNDISLSHDLRQWWEVLANQFLIVDRSMIDLFWPKYNYNVDQRLSILWDNSNMALCHFSQWMQIYSRGLSPSITLDELRRQTVHDKLDFAA